MPKPIFSLTTEGADPKWTSRELLETEINRVVGATYDQANPEDRAAAADSATAAAQDAASALASAAAANLAKASAQTAAEASGNVIFYDTKAAATAAVGGLAEGQIVRVFADESQGGTQEFYRKTSGALVHKPVLRQGKSIYVDSVRGSDANDGRSSATPLKTIAALKPLVRNGDEIWLAAGSHWREELDLFGFRGVHVRRYGFGARPILDGADIVPNGNFSKTGGYTNVYQTSVMHGMSGTIRTFSVWENGVRLIRATSIANCDATPGSFYAPAVGASPQTIHVHATGGGNPSGNGRLYEVSLRTLGLRGAFPGHIIGIHTRRTCWDHGSLFSFDYAYDCLAEDGTKHNFWNEGLAEKCIAWKGEKLPGAGSSTLFISYRDDATGGSARYVDCQALGDGGAGQVGFYVHTAGGGAAQNWKKIIYERCIAVSLAQGFGVANVDVMGLLECEAYKTRTGVAAGAVKNVLCGGVFSAWDADILTNFRAVSFAGGSWFVRGASFLARVASGGMVYGDFTTVDVQNCDFVFLNKSSPRCAFDVNNAAANVTSRRNVFYDVDHAVYDLANGATLDSNYNVFSAATGDVILSGTTYPDIAAYQAATGKDAASSVSDPLMVAGGRMQRPAYGPASAAWTLRAGASAISAGELRTMFLAETA